MTKAKFFDGYFTALGWSQERRDFIIDELSGPHRRYHGLGHHALMLQELHYNHVPFFSRELFAATLLHDIFYDATRQDNEERSAELALEWLSEDAKTSDDPVDTQWVYDAIMATKSHVLGPADTARDGAIQKFLRADLMILWTDHTSRYSWYAHGVRFEYGHVPNELYRQGRAAVLEKLRGQIHPHLHARDSIQMSRNIDWEIAEISRGTFDV